MITFLFDMRRDEAVVSGLGNDYKSEIKKQLRERSGRGDDLTVRFSFINSECFNMLQLCDVLLYMVKLRIEKENGLVLSNEQKGILKIWEDNFLDSNIKELKDYEYDEKFNFFLSNR